MFGIVEVRNSFRLAYLDIIVDGIIFGFACDQAHQINDFKFQYKRIKIL